MSKYLKYSLFIIWFCLFACNDEGNKKNNISKIKQQDTLSSRNKRIVDSLSTRNKQNKKQLSQLEQKLINAGLIDIQTLDSSILVDVRYATKNNFMGEVLYPNYHKVYLQSIVAKRLITAQKYLKKIDSNLTLYVFDGARPQSVQQAMWDALDTIPVNKRTRFLSNPKNGSIHNYGCAVDLTIKDLETDTLLDMGARYDDLRRIAYPRYEEEFLKKGLLTPQQVSNRKLLRRVMNIGGFWVIQTEWWHFNAFTREKAKKMFSIIK